VLVHRHGPVHRLHRHQEDLAIGGKDVGEDKWHFYKDDKGEWRWKRVAPNGEVVAAASEGYVDIQDARINAARNGWDGEDSSQEEDS